MADNQENEILQDQDKECAQQPGENDEAECEASLEQRASGVEPGYTNIDQVLIDNVDEQNSVQAAYHSEADDSICPEEGNRNPECGIKGEETADENKSEVPDLNQYLTSDRSVEQGQEMFQQEQTEGKSDMMKTLDEKIDYVEDIDDDVVICNESEMNVEQKDELIELDVFIEDDEKCHDVDEEEAQLQDMPASSAPQSDAFADGDRPESVSAFRVGEKLSRDPSPTDQGELFGKRPDSVEPSTPDQLASDTNLRQDTTQECDIEVLEEHDGNVFAFDREDLIEKYHAAVGERETLLQQNYQLQHKLAEYFRKRRNDGDRPEYDKNAADQEQRYLKYMAQLDHLRLQLKSDKEHCDQLIVEHKVRSGERQQVVQDEQAMFAGIKKQVALNSINSRSGRPFHPKDIQQYLLLESRKEAEVVNVRLENIKLKNRLKKEEQKLRSKEELAEGLHLIDFEQLKIENQTYNEKIEERNEELLKLRKKITSTVQVLTHLKEKLQFVKGERQIKKSLLQEVDVAVAQKRDMLSRTKRARDSLRVDNNKQRQNCGLLGNTLLLRDYEGRKDESDELRCRLNRLKMQHADMSLNCGQIRRKIDEARSIVA